MFPYAPPSFAIPALLAGLLAAAVWSQPAPAEAEGAPDMAGGIAKVALIDGWRAPDGSIVAGLSLTLAPGWHTYWRDPGEVGVAPRFDWSASNNLAGLAISWPRPRLFEAFGSRSIGYDGTVVLPITLMPSDPARPVDLALDVSFGVCSEVCVPDEVSVAGRFAPKPDAPDPEPIRAALADRPMTPREAGVKDVTCDLSEGADGLEMETVVTFDRPAAPDQMAVIESAQPGLWIGSPDVRGEGHVLTARAPVETHGRAIDRGGLRVTLIGAGSAVDIVGCGAPALQASAER